MSAFELRAAGGSPEIDAREREFLARSTAGPVVHVDGVGRTFGEVTALTAVDLDVEAGRVHALLGPNGAGKTTLLRILTGLVEPSSGNVTVMDRDAREHGLALRRFIGFVPSGDRAFYLRLSGVENLAFFGRLQGLSRAEALRRGRARIADVGLADAANRRVGAYSHGMQKRLAVARALLVDPPVLLVDEATHDLDPEGARRIQELVTDAANRGTGVLWTTQRLDEIRGFAHSVTLLAEGRTRFTGTVPELMAHARTRRYLLHIRPQRGSTADLDKWRRALGDEADLVPSDGFDDNHLLLVVADDAVLGGVIARLDAAGADVLSCTEERSRVEAAFLDLTAREVTAEENEAGPTEAHASAPSDADSEEHLPPAPPAAAAPRRAPDAGSRRLSMAERAALVGAELRKLPAFGRRDLMIQLSYRTAYLSDLLSLALQTVVFAFVGRLVDPRTIPGVPPGVGNPYLAFVAIGIAVAAFMQLGLGRVVAAVQNEQAIGTLDSLLVTPTSFPTIQLGSAVYDLLYVPLRTVVFLGTVSLVFGMHFRVGGLLPAATVLLLFVPVVWGVGVICAAAVLTFRRGGNLVAFAAAASSLASGAFFPLTLFPGWLRHLAELNPMALTLKDMRATLVNGSGWSAISGGIAALAIIAVVSLTLGTLAFRAAVARERRLGTIGLY